MKKLFKSPVVKDTSIYTFFNVLDKLIPFLLLPILTRVLSVEDIGTYMLFTTVLEFIVPIVSVNIDSVYTINFFKYKKIELDKFISSSLQIIVILFLLAGFAGVIYKSLFNSEQIGSLFIIILLSLTLFRVPIQLLQAYWRITQKAVKYGAFALSISLIKFGSAILYIFVISKSWEGLAIGYFTSYLIGFIISIYVLRKSFDVEFKFNRFYNKYVKDLIITGGPLTLHKIGALLGSTLNRIMLSSILNIAATGLYGVAAIFGGIITIIEGSVNKAIVPVLFKKLANNLSSKDKKDIARLTIGFYISITIVAILVSVTGYLSINLLFGDKYYASKEFIMPLVVAALLRAFYKMHVNYILFSKKTYKITLVTGITGLVNIPLTYFSITYFGIIGAAYSLVVINLIQYLAVFILSIKYLNPSFFRIFQKKTVG